MKLETLTHTPALIEVLDAIETLNAAIYMFSITDADMERESYLSKAQDAVTKLNQSVNLVDKSQLTRAHSLLFKSAMLNQTLAIKLIRERKK